MKGLIIVRKIRSFLCIVKMSFMHRLIYRSSLFISLATNGIYMFMTYFLWRAIFDSTPNGVINGMTFKDTFIYLALSGCISSSIVSFLEWNMSSDVKSGDVAVWFIKPISYPQYMCSRSFGNISTNFIMTFIPTFIFVFFLTKGYIDIGINIIMFVIAFFIAVPISMMLDFLIGILSFSTENVWGISTMKDSIVLLLAGAIVPLAFFPEPIRKVVEWLPFQTIYNLPLQILINKNYDFKDYVGQILIQLVWLAILFIISTLCYRKAARRMIVNGG